MKYSSSEYPSHKKINNKKEMNTNDKYKAKVKIPNYSTPLQNTSNSYNRFDTPSKNPINKFSSSPANSSPRRPLPMNDCKQSPTQNNSTYYSNWNDGTQNQHNNYEDSTFKGPVGVPMMPLYGYDNYDDAEKDWAYFRQLHPSTAKRVLQEVDKECDKLEYDGSCMFDEYPDRIYLGKIVERIYVIIKDEIEEPVLYSKSLEKSSNFPQDDDEFQDCEPKKTSSNKDKVVEIKQYNRNSNRRRPLRSNNWLRDFVEILLYQEIINRRRRYRSRRRWF